MPASSSLSGGALLYSLYSVDLKDCPVSRAMPGGALLCHLRSPGKVLLPQHH
ncbi:hypothetical protein M378DRAFT_164336 [Amanita muscaria Koide BX008]|uniref:Uncharacterized protein n=1 Tax=Amanita muscaria (strain Koide BX008) TaxID=946122 RepID=A0A0C2WPB6_AMAMK|nr:hypothetical protein M378DRAFT_164336 [Amanita muscaria Koide BX008]